jgi:ABC-type nickel/cobalt efflux system permease component RcnA
MMSKAQRWSRPKTMLVTFLCGLGHVGSSVVIGVALVLIGMAVGEWEGSSWADIHEYRGDLAAWLLIGIGAAFGVWGTVRALRGQSHTHAHMHEGETSHAHQHQHSKDHMHVHDAKVKGLTPWVLFTIFIFGPCESLIPLMLAAWAVAGWSGTALVAGIFSAITVLTILLTVELLLLGISRIPLGKLDRWSTALAGLSLVACGAAILWLGL